MFFIKISDILLNAIGIWEKNKHSPDLYKQIKKYFYDMDVDILKNIAIEVDEILRTKSNVENGIGLLGVCATVISIINEYVCFAIILGGIAVVLWFLMVAYEETDFRKYRFMKSVLADVIEAKKDRH